MVFYILYLVLFFIYFILYWLLPFFIRSPLFLFGPLFFIWHPPFYLVIKDQFIFICHPFAPAPTAILLLLLLLLLLQVVLVLGFRSIVVCSYLQNVLEIIKMCKTHYKCHYTTMIYAPVFMLPIIPSVISLKKNNYFLSTSHLVYPFQKKCCVVLLTSASVYYVTIHAIIRKKKKYNANGVVLHVIPTIKRMNGVIIVVIVGKKLV